MKSIILTLSLVFSVSAFAALRIYSHQQIITAQAMTAQRASSKLITSQAALLSIQATWTTSSAAGVLWLEGSDSLPSVADASIIWSSISGSSTAVSGAGNFLWSMSDTAYRYVRMVFGPTAGSSGTLDAYAIVKSLN